MHTGNSISGKDGLLYRSEVEKKFADTYLWKKYDYVYEHPYGFNTKYTCDFYLPQLGLWIEIVPVEESLGEDVETHSVRVQPFVDINLPFVDKEFGKDYGAKWDSNRKVWYISSDNYFMWKNHPRLSSFLPPANQVEQNETKTVLADPNWKSYFDTIKTKRKLVVEKHNGIFVVVCADYLRKGADNSLMMLLLNRENRKPLLGLNDFCRVVVSLEKIAYNSDYSAEKIECADKQGILLAEANSTILRLTVENKNLTKCIKEVNSKFTENRNPSKPKPQHSASELARRAEIRRKKKLRQKLRRAGQPIPSELLP